MINCVPTIVSQFKLHQIRNSFKRKKLSQGCHLTRKAFQLRFIYNHCKNIKKYSLIYSKPLFLFYFDLKAVFRMRGMCLL